MYAHNVCVCEVWSSWCCTRIYRKCILVQVTHEAVQLHFYPIHTNVCKLTCINYHKCVYIISAAWHISLGMW